MSSARVGFWCRLTILYIGIVVSFTWVFWKIFIKKDIPKIVVVPFILNIFFNVIFTPIQFGLQNLTLALLDIWAVLLTIIWMMMVIQPYNKCIAWAQAPYLVWVSFATVLQFAIFWLN